MEKIKAYKAFDKDLKSRDLQAELSISALTNEHFSFESALTYLKEGKRLSREGWNGANQFIEMQRPDEHSKMRRPYLYISPVDGLLVPWIASQTDLLADDWFVLVN